MSNLVFGKNGQVRFNSEEELRIAVDYILNSDNVDFEIHEDNQNQGAWAPEAVSYTHLDVYKRQD